MNKFNDLLLTLALLAGGLSAACRASRPCPGGDLHPIDQPPSFAVVFSDYVSTAVGLLDAQGALMTESWIDSGSFVSESTAALSGDVVLPSTVTADDELVLIDRLGVDVVTRIKISARQVLSQSHVQLPPSDGQAGYRANPQDAVQLADGRWMVSRYEPNSAPNSAPLDSGNDLVILSEAGALTNRIGFSRFDTRVGSETVFARPGHLARLDAYWLVSMSRLSADFSTAAEGAVAVLEDASLAKPAEAKLTSLAVEGLENCSTLNASPKKKSAWLACVGRAFADGEARRETAGLAVIESQGVPEVTRIWRAKEHDTLPTPAGPLAALDERRVAYVGLGTDGGGDKLVILDLESSASYPLHQAEAAFSLGQGTFDADEGRLLWPDREQGVLLFDLTELRLESPTAAGAVGAETCHGLPPTEVRPLLPPSRP